MEICEHLIKFCLQYGLEIRSRSLDFVVVRFLMKLFKTVNTEIIRECCSYFKFRLPSELLDNRRDGINSNAILCYALVCCIILASRYNTLMYLS